MIESLSTLIGLMKSYSVKRIYAKKLSPNDNSKNQVYLGGDFSVLNIIPHHEVRGDDSLTAGSKRDREKAKVSFFWIDEEGRYEAPGTQLVLYPKYPEVRMSGFLKGCCKPPRDIMKVRDDGRVLLLGVTDSGEILGYAAGSEDLIAKEFLQMEKTRSIGVFVDLTSLICREDTLLLLLYKLTEIYRKGWINSQKIGKNGNIYPYRAANGGGYTLEAELGVAPNGCSEPDYLGWEIKQFSVNDFERCRPKSPITLMTPEPNAGLYKDEGVAEFITRYGYADKNGVQDRRNFGGIYECGGDYNVNTSLRLDVVGYNKPSGKIIDLDGGIALIDRKGAVAAQWRFREMMNHWTRKHAQAAYVPSMSRKPPPEYCYGPSFLLCTGADFGLFIKAVVAGVVYYDPGIKMEKSSSGKPVIKRRSQFRVKLSSLPELYQKSEWSKPIDW